ncbi:hypothetical protein D4R42_04420 [bacterium]|nr:MAG: hypothetical protein D4R42_04420 [bacterium]
MAPKRRRRGLFDDWHLMTEDERLERVARMKAKHRAAIKFLDGKELRRKEYVDEITQLSLELVRNTSYIVTDNFKCPDCGGNEFHVAETIGGKMMESKRRKYKLYEITMTCLNKGHCSMQRRLRYREYIDEPLMARLEALDIRALITITV